MSLMSHHLTIWTDGCGTQFKSKLQFFKISKMTMRVRHRFFASGHGKGPSDAEGAVVICGWSAIHFYCKSVVSLHFRTISQYNITK